MKNILLSAAALFCSLTSLSTQAANNDHAKRPAGYEIETIKMPKGVVMHITGVAFDGKGGVYTCSREGEVWHYSAEGQWKLFAQGLQDSCGLHYEATEKALYVAQKPELTRLLDNDGDGRCDRQETVADNWGYSGNYHEFHFGPVRDSKGNFYGSLNLSHGKGRNLFKSCMSTAANLRGICYQVDKKGQFKPFAWGLRSPAGIGISPQDEIFITDNQGDWIPTSNMSHIKKGQFYGASQSLHDHPAYGKDRILELGVPGLKKLRTLPVVWFPHGQIANSPGNPVFDTTAGQFGPFAGQIFVGDQGRSNLFRVGVEKVAANYQGWCINFIDRLQSGVIRAKFDSQGNLWAGQCSRGWGSAGNVPFGLQKVSFTGKEAPFCFHSMQLTEKGFRLQFTQKIKTLPTKLNIKTWTYKYGPQYGSPKVDLKDIQATNIRLATDGKSIEFDCQLERERVYAIDMKAVESATGQKLVHSKVFYTLNALKGDKNTQVLLDSQKKNKKIKVSGFKDTPLLPGGKWHVHDPDRPQPKRVKGHCLSTPAPADATVLFDGKNLDAFKNKRWKIENAEMIVRAGNQHTVNSFGDCQLHLEFMIPKRFATGNQAGNSGVFFMGKYELQILNGWESATYADGTIGAVYGQTPPLVNACNPPDTWNSYDITFKAPRFDKQGKLISPARITARLNGVLVQKNTEFQGPTRYRALANYNKAHPAKLPLMLQNHGDALHFRNIWIKEL